MYAFVNEYCMLSINVSSVTRVYFLICVLSYTLPVTNAASGELGFAIFSDKRKKAFKCQLAVYKLL